MKKISLFLVTAILMIAFAACNGAKKTETPAEEPVKNETVDTTAIVSEPQPEAPALSPADMLKEFQDYAKAYGEAFNNLAKDPQKYTDLSGQYQKRISDMEKIKSELNAKQLQDYQKAIDIIRQVNSGGKK